VQAVIDKMLGCGTPEAGYTTYLCPPCLEEKWVAFSCKSSFCLSSTSKFGLQRVRGCQWTPTRVR